ncbi:MAG: hypothetical protein Q9159_003517 [Coniocarpon cinnabarinum]
MTTPVPAIHCDNLSYTFPSHTEPTLHPLSLTLPRGSRTLLIGANGAGKTTLLRLLSGKSMPPASSTVQIDGNNPFSSALPSTIAYLGSEWVLNPVVRSDISVPELLASVGGDRYPDRRDELVEILDIDSAWRMHAVSDGERRRVQLAMGLLRPWDVLLLDEVTVDLDLLARTRFLDFLKRETEQRGSTVVYATHIFDGLGGWPSHLVRMATGRVKEWGPVDEIVNKGQPGDRVGHSALGRLVLRWLEEDLKERGPRRAGVAERKMAVVNGIGGYGMEKRREARGA